MRGPGAELAAIGFARHIVAIFGGAGLSRDGNRELHRVAKDLVQRAAMDASLVVSYGEAHPFLDLLNHERVHRFKVFRLRAVWAFAVILTDEGGLGDVPFRGGIEWRDLVTGWAGFCIRDQARGRVVPFFDDLAFTVLHFAHDGGLH